MTSAPSLPATIRPVFVAGSLVRITNPACALAPCKLGAVHVVAREENENEIVTLENESGTTFGIYPHGIELAAPSVFVTDCKGNSHPVIAAKRKDSFRVIVLREWSSLSTPYVVHTFNEQDGGFHHGHYCGTLARAREVFDAKE